MPGKMLLLRHGQIKANRQRRWHGSTDSPLTFIGRRQAKRVSRLLKNQPLSAVYASPLQRCQQTATLATRHSGLAINTMDGLAEMSVGEWENTLFKDLAQEHGFFEKLSADPDHRAPGGESTAEVFDRAYEALCEIDANHGADDVVVVCGHGVTFGVLLAKLINNNPCAWPEFQMSNCGITEFELSPGPLIISFNSSYLVT